MNAHLDAVVAALNTVLGALSTPRSAYAVGDTPNPPPTIGYVEVDIERRFVSGNPRGDGSKGYDGYRVSARAVAMSADNARVLLGLCDDTLDEQHITVDGRSVPLTFETGSSVAPDDGWHSGSHDYILAD